MTLDISSGNLSLLENTLGRRARLFRIILRRGEILRLTTWDRNIEFNGEVYLATDPVDTTARRAQSGLAAAGQELSGAISSDLIKVEDLAAGFYDRARIDEWEVDPKYAFLGHFSAKTYFIDTVTFDGEKWSAEAVGIEKILDNKMTETLNKDCSWDLGEPHCNRAITTIGNPAESGDAAPTPNWTTNETLLSVNRFVDTVESERLIFTANATGGFTNPIPANYEDRTLPDGSVDKFFQFGRIKWTEGDNAGQVNRIIDYEHRDGGGALSRKIFLANLTGYPIQPGDAFTITAGCSRTTAACLYKFNNLQNHRGFTFIPTGEQSVSVQ